jgi:hypothetical protein
MIVHFLAALVAALLGFSATTWWLEYRNCSKSLFQGAVAPRVRKKRYTRGFYQQAPTSPDDRSLNALPPASTAAETTSSPLYTICDKGAASAKQQVDASTSDAQACSEPTAVLHRRQQEPIYESGSTWNLQHPPCMRCRIVAAKKGCVNRCCRVCCVASRNHDCKAHFTLRERLEVCIEM